MGRRPQLNRHGTQTLIMVVLAMALVVGVFVAGYWTCRGVEAVDRVVNPDRHAPASTPSDPGGYVDPR